MNQATRFSLSRLKFHFETLLGKMVQPAPQSPEDVERPYLRAANVLDGHVDLSDVKKMWFSPRERVRYDLRAGDLLVLEGGDVGRCSLWNGEIEDVGFQNSLHRLRPLPGNSNRFALYWFQHLKSTGYFSQISSQATLAHFTAEKLRETPFPRISLAIQEGIADFLDRETARIDALIAKKRRLTEVLREKRESFTSRVVLEGLASDTAFRETSSPYVPRIPAHWSLVRLKQIATVRGGIALGRPVPAGVKTVTVPYLRVANVQAGWLDLSDVATLTITEDELKRFRLESGDVLMLEGGDNDKLGRGTVWNGEIELCVHQNHVFVVKPRDNSLGEWISFCSNARYGRDFFFLNSRQSTNLASVSKSRLEEFPVPMPPLAERLTLVERIRDHQSRIDHALRAVQKSIEKLRELRIALITAAVTGQIDVDSWQRRGQTDRAVDEIESNVTGA